MTASDAPSLHVEAVTKRFGSLTVLRGLNLSLGRGDVCGVVGANGSGKSTLLQLISGQLSPDSGSITICGQRLGARPWFSTRSDARRFASLFPDQNDALLDLTGYEFLNLHYALRGIVPGPGEAAIEEALGLRAFAGQRLRVLSLGQRKRVHFAGSLAGAPPVWLLDEPTNALDAAACAYLAAVIAERRSAGLVTLAATHDESALRAWDAQLVSIAELQVRH